MSQAQAPASAYLDGYLDALKPLPTEFRRNLALLQKLDVLCEQAKNRMQTIGDDLLKQNDPNLESLLELRKLQRAAHALQVEKIALNQENELMVRNFIQRLNEDMGKFEKEFSNGAPADEPEDVRYPPPITGKSSKVPSKLSKTASRSSKYKEDGDGEFDEEETDGDQEPICYCNSVSHGEMVACDNENCEIEWFHFACVGLKKKPTGRWFCPDCAKLS